MALIECPECHHEVSDKADKCPNCSYPLAPVDVGTPSSAVKNPYRSGAIMGLIGSIAFIAISAIGLAGASGVEVFDVGMISVQGAPSMLYIAPLFCILANTLVFGSALVMVKAANRKALLVLAAIAMVLSLVGTVGMVLFLNIMALCIGPLFLWEPVLQLVGAVKMVNAALKTNE